MRQVYRPILLLSLLLIFSCKGSDSYQSTWKGTDMEGDQFTIHFEPKEIIIEKEGDTQSMGYKQNAISYENGKKSYGIQLENGLSYTISFPIAKQKNRALILVGEERPLRPLYVIHRSEYMNYDEFYNFLN